MAEDLKFWMLSKVHEIRRDDYCLDYDMQSNAIVMIWECHGQGGNQKWLYDDKVGPILLLNSSHSWLYSSKYKN